jgi:hypothetical protein
MTRYSVPDRLPSPDDYQQPGNSPAVIQALADATQAALINRASQAQAAVDTAAAHAAAAYAPAVHAHQYSAQLLPNAYFPTVHDGQIALGLWNVGDLAAGQEKVVDWPVTGGTFVFAQVQHPSTWIYVTADLIGATNLRMRVRNGTASTNHTNVKVHVMVIDPPPGP